jgi:uncharacterized protein (DUF4415 family)
MNFEFDWVLAPSISIQSSEELQDIFFFNSNQKRYTKKIVKTINKYGKPKVVVENNQITIRLDSDNLNQQTLFVLDKSNNNLLIGVLLYVKENDTINIIHLALNEAHQEYLNKYGYSVFNLIINQFAKMLRNIKDIKFVKFQYNSLVVELEKISELL